MRSEFDIVCLSHLRWDWVYQRPQHLLSRFARHGRVFFFEEPVFDSDPACVDYEQREGNVTVVTPRLPAGTPQYKAHQFQRQVLDETLAANRVRNPVIWYYTPMALAFSQHLRGAATVFDCMDELSAFDGASAELLQREDDLFRRADLVFTGGVSLFEAKRGRHSNIHAFPSSVDAAHFLKARTTTGQPADQAGIAGSRLGYAGVIDERMDLPLIAALAEARPEWQIILVGPVTKIDEAMLPRAANIHYLGPKKYTDLPSYLSGWDVGLMPFARNRATRFISPTKTPEYLAAGLPVVSTSIRDVVRPYGELGLVHIADEPADFVAAVETAMTEDAVLRRQRVDSLLRDNSWDRTWAQMNALVGAAIEARQPARQRVPQGSAVLANVRARAKS